MPEEGQTVTQHLILVFSVTVYYDPWDSWTASASALGTQAPGFAPLATGILLSGICDLLSITTSRLLIPSSDEALSLFSHRRSYGST